MATGGLAIIDAALMWSIIWMNGDSEAGVPLGRTAGMITALLVVLGVALVVLAMVRGPRLRPARVAAWVSHITGIALLGIVAGIAIIYVTSSLVAMLIALMRRYTLVPRDPPVEQDVRP